MVILSARVRAPKDKAAVEGTVGIISTFILTALRNRQFLSLLELNEAIYERLETFNYKPFQKREGNRARIKPYPKQSTATASSSQYGFTRGADYYGKGESVMLTETMVSKLREMRLSVLANALKDQLANPQFQNMAFEEQLGILVDAE